MTRVDTGWLHRSAILVPQIRKFRSADPQVSIRGSAIIGLLDSWLLGAGPGSSGRSWVRGSVLGLIPGPGVSSLSLGSSGLVRGPRVAPGSWGRSLGLARGPGVGSLSLGSSGLVRGSWVDPGSWGDSCGWSGSRGWFVQGRRSQPLLAPSVWEDPRSAILGPFRRSASLVPQIRKFRPCKRMREGGVDLLGL